MVAQYEVTAHRRFGNDHMNLFVWEPEALKAEARLAVTLIEKWGMVAATETTEEDSAGRAKLRLQTPDEVVSRACRTAEIAMQEFRDRGWIVPLPGPDEARALMKKDD